MQKIRKSRIVLLVAAVIIIIAGALIVKQFVFGNPLQGKWVTSKGEYYLTIEEDQEAELLVLVNEEMVEVDIRYEIDRNSRMITLYVDSATEYEDAVDDFDGKVSVAELSDKLEVILTSFDYSMEQNTLTLTEREYGEQIIFTRVK